MKSITTLIFLVLILLGALIFMESQYEGISKEQGDAILKELIEVRQELNQIKQKVLIPQGRAKPTLVKMARVSTLGNPSLGNLEAPVTIVEFTDYQCPYCQKFYSKAYKELKTQYVEAGKLRFVLRDLPLPIHLHAKPAAISAHCAGEQNKFWEMHDALFEGEGKLNPDDISLYAKSIGLDNISFQDCLTSGKFNKDIAQDVQDAKKASIKGTPSFVVGLTTDNFVNGIIIRGTRPLIAFKQEIDRLLQ